MGLKGLDAGSVATKQNIGDEEALKTFIGGAAVQAGNQPAAAPQPKPAAKKAKGAKFARTNFSLSDKVNKQIDQLSLVPRTFKVSRSDIVRAGVVALKAMPRAQLVALLATVVGADDSEEEQDG